MLLLALSTWTGTVSLWVLAHNLNGAQARRSVWKAVQTAMNNPTGCEMPTLIPLRQLHLPQRDPSIRRPVGLFPLSIHLSRARNRLQRRTSRTFCARLGGDNPLVLSMKANPYLGLMNLQPHSPSSKAKYPIGSKRWRPPKQLKRLPLLRKRNCPIGSIRSAQDHSPFQHLLIQIRLIG